MQKEKVFYTDKASQDDWSTHWTAYADATTKNPGQAMRHQFLIEYIRGCNKEKKIDSLLDIGSGQGDFLAKAVANKLAQKYIGFEMSTTGVEISQKKISTALFFQVNMLNPPPNIYIYFISGM